MNFISKILGQFSSILSENLERVDHVAEGDILYVLSDISVINFRNKFPAVVLDEVEHTIDEAGEGLTLCRIYVPSIQIMHYAVAAVDDNGMILKNYFTGVCGVHYRDELSPFPELVELGIRSALSVPKTTSLEVCDSKGGSESILPSLVEITCLGSDACTISYKGNTAVFNDTNYREFTGAYNSTIMITLGFMAAKCPNAYRFLARESSPMG